MEKGPGMKAVILCGGIGTRLREETEFKPKPMVTVGSMPIVWHIMKIYSHFGIRDFVLCLGYKGEVIRQFFLEQGLGGSELPAGVKAGEKKAHGAAEMEDWNVTLAETGLNAMTGARVKKIEKYIGEDQFMLTYGDGLADVNIGALLAHHAKKGKIGTITGVNLPSRFGMLKAGADDIVSEFVEKPILEDWINGGFSVFKKDMFDYLQNDDSCVLETAPLSKLASERQLSLYRHKGFWQCMDTYRDYMELNKIWDSGKVPWKIW